MLNIVDWNVSVIIPNAMNIKLQYKRAGLSNTLCISDLEWTILFDGDRQEENKTDVNISGDSASSPSPMLVESTKFLLRPATTLTERR